MDVQIRVNWYTNVLLTIIATCLVLGLARDLSAPAHAGSGPMQVDIVRVGGLSIGKAVPVSPR